MPAGPSAGDKLETTGVASTVKPTPGLGNPLTVTNTLPVVDPAGTVATIEVKLQLVIVVAVVPLKVTVLVPCVEPKFAPASVIDAPTGPDVGDRLLMVGPTITVNATPLLGVPPTVTTTFPVVAPAGTGTMMLASFQFVGVAVTPLNVTVLEPWPG